jgi:hypothetical protein
MILTVKMSMENWWNDTDSEDECGALVECY